jgi:hypothetical protein
VRRLHRQVVAPSWRGSPARTSRRAKNICDGAVKVHLEPPHYAGEFTSRLPRRRRAPDPRALSKAAPAPLGSPPPTRARHRRRSGYPPLSSTSGYQLQTFAVSPSPALRCSAGVDQRIARPAAARPSMRRPVGIEVLASISPEAHSSSSPPPMRRREVHLERSPTVAAERMRTENQHLSTGERVDRHQ